MIAAHPDPVFVGSFPGITAVGLNPFIGEIGTTDAGGTLVFTSPVPSLTGAKDFRRFTIQIAAVTATGIELANPSIVQDVKSSF